MRRGGAKSPQESTRGSVLDEYTFHTTFGSRVRGFDREFLRALALAARSDKVVLGEISELIANPSLAVTILYAVLRSRFC